MVALALLAAVFSTMGGLGCAPVATRPVRAGIISMAMLAVFLRGVGLLVPNRVMMGEIPHPQLRDQTTMVALTASQIFDFTTSFTFPYLLNPPYANLRSRVGFVFAPFCALGVVFVYFCVPDLSRRSLEEIEEIFRMKVPAKKTRREFFVFPPPHPTMINLPYLGGGGDEWVLTTRINNCLQIGNRPTAKPPGRGSRPWKTGASRTRRVRPAWRWSRWRRRRRRPGRPVLQTIRPEVPRGPGNEVRPSRLDQSSYMVSGENSLARSGRTGPLCYVVSGGGRSLSNPTTDGTYLYKVYTQ